MLFVAAVWKHTGHADLDRCAIEAVARTAVEYKFKRSAIRACAHAAAFARILIRVARQAARIGERVVSDSMQLDGPPDRARSYVSRDRQQFSRRRWRRIPGAARRHRSSRRPAQTLMHWSDILSQASAVRPLAPDRSAAHQPSDGPAKLKRAGAIIRDSRFARFFHAPHPC